MSDVKDLPIGAHIRQGSNAGQPMTRRDGRLKVTGAATYAVDNNPDGLLHAVLVPATISRGRVLSLDVEAAKAHPGVVDVMTPANRPALALDPDDKPNPFAFRMDVLQNEGVRYAGQPIAVVIAETLEAANEGVSLLAPKYETETASADLSGESYRPEAVGPGMPASVTTGDFDEAFAAAENRVEATFETPPQYHNAMEPHSVVARWDGDRLEADMPTQGLGMARMRIAALFDIDPENVTLRSPFLGGGFGSKGLMIGPQLLGILAAKHVGRPVKMALRREQMFGPVGHRGQTQQSFRVGFGADGHMTALSQHTKASTSRFDEFVEPASNPAYMVYGADNISATHEAVRIDIGTPQFMRAPGEATGSITLESMIDEAAHAIGMDPLAFRLANYAEVDPAEKKPYSSKALRECYDKGAKAFGWEGRPLQPRQMRDDDGLLVGWGMGTAIFPAPMMQGQARVVIRADGGGILETGAHDMGQGAWTALHQIGADAIALPIDAVEFRSGTTDQPDGGLAGGSAHTATVGTALHKAGEDAIGKLIEMAVSDEASPLFGAGNVGVLARDGRLVRQDDESVGESFGDILRRAGREEIDGTGTGAADEAVRERYAMYAHGAVFAEVKVDPDLGQVRAGRLVGAFAAGRIINPRLVRSQYYGGMIWGLSFVLHEEALHDPRTGRIMNANLAEYHVPVNADVPPMEAILVHEEDPHVNPLGIKGVGEIGITGTGGAIANAIWHATGKRVRRFPIRPADLL